jgi:2-keto-4-pentenoate hydratase/2-oxohepta-3-ene-1,7-dioic acid hydratase in catechol pathway
VKLVTFELAGAARAGVLEDRQIWPLDSALSVQDALELSGHERTALLAAARLRAEPILVAETRLLAPLMPLTLRDFVCFEQHVEGVVKTASPDAQVMPDWYEAPTFYFSNSNAIFGPGDEIEVPPGCRLLDFELEVGVVIGVGGRDIPPHNAWEHIAGFTIFNDFSARDHGAREVRMGLGFAKAKDFANVLGPSVVTADELEPFRRGDRLALQCRAYRNGELVGEDSLANMAWSFGEMIAYASRGTRVEPGDVLGSGTCGGGCLAEWWGRNGALEPRPLAPGDEVSLEVEALGVLSNVIVAGVEPIPIPRAQARSNKTT